MGRVVAGQLLHQKSKDMRRVAKCPLDWAEAAIVGSLVDLRDHIVQGSHQATGILSQSGVGWWNNVTARRVTWCRLSRIARRVCVCLSWAHLELDAMFCAPLPHLVRAPCPMSVHLQNLHRTKVSCPGL